MDGETLSWHSFFHSEIQNVTYLHSSISVTFILIFSEEHLKSFSQLMTYYILTQTADILRNY